VWAKTSQSGTQLWEAVVPLIFPSTHPVVHQHLAALRDMRTRPPEFRRLVKSLAVLLTHEATADLPTRPTEVATPLGTASCRVLAETLGIVPILRAGLGMAEGILEHLPDAEVWHIGLYRDEETLLPKEYYRKLPTNPRITVALVVDPMLATGGSAVHACEILKSAGVARMKLISLIAAPEGIARVTERVPEVAIHVGAIVFGLFLV
jgi:uracil phosphoribosyltransferase